MHAGGDQAAGDPIQGSDAIRSHRWFPNLQGGGPHGFVGVNVGTNTGLLTSTLGPNNPTGVWIFDYTVRPENGGLACSRTSTLTPSVCRTSTTRPETPAARRIRPRSGRSGRGSNIGDGGSNIGDGGPAGIGDAPTPYQHGMLLWYWNDAYGDNSVGDHPGRGCSSRSTRTRG